MSKKKLGRITGYQPEPLVGDHELIPPSTGSNVKKPKVPFRGLVTPETPVAGKIYECVVCGRKFIQADGLNNPMCPKCIEETVARHKDEMAEKCVTSPNSILGNKPVTPFSCPVRVPEEGTLELDDSIPSHVVDAQMYASGRVFTKKDSGKLQWSLMPFEELKDVVKVLMLGAVKYSPDNWKKCDNVVRYKDALMRHVISYIEGDETDEESGLSHLAHAVCNCLFLMWFDKQKSKD